MSVISLDNILIHANTLEYQFSYDEDMAKYFTGKSFSIEFPENIEDVPVAVLAIPFVTNVLPIIWLKQATLRISELDESFYQAIPEFKQGYIDMYPDAEWGGSVEVQRLVSCEPDTSEEKTALFFSGGLDATTTVMRHYHEHPDMIAIWGSDVAYSNDCGWSVMNASLSDTAEKYGLELVVIHSSFRDFCNESVLEREFYPVLHDGWWHGVKHGIGLIGHAAPYSWLHRIKRFYIASSNCPADGKVTCASHPTIDNFVKFCGCQVVHDGYELSRQDKIEYVVSCQKKLELDVSLHVCWESQTGQNCCHCEKCYRTMVGLWAEGADPKEYGFLYDPNTIFHDIYTLMALQYKYGKNIVLQWKHIQRAIIENWDRIKAKNYSKGLKWIKKFNFDDAENNRCRKVYKLKQGISNWKSVLAEKFPRVYSMYKRITRK